MKYKLLILALISSYYVEACDICGCQLGAYTFGILSQNPTHFVGLRYSQAHFNAHIDNEILEDEYSDDTYRIVELMGRYVINSKWYLTVSIPYGINDMKGNAQELKIHGVGDPVLLGYYNVFNSTSENFRTWYHSMLVGAGLKFPLGKYDAEDQDEIINRNFQLGSGSLDYLFSGIYTIKYKSWGVNLEASYKLNTANKLDYRIGNQLNTQVKIYYALIQPNYSLLPYLGAVYEQSQQHSDEGFIQVNTGGEVSMAQIGLQAYAGPLMLMANYNWVMKQNFNTDDRSSIASKDRFQMGLVFNIPTAKKMEMDL